MPGLLSGLERLPEQLAAFWKGLSGAQRFAFISIVLMTFGGVALLVNIAGEPQYAVLYSDLSPEDSAKIVDELSTGQVPFKLTHAGTTVQVPLERVYDVRLELAAKGMPTSGPIGFEVFDGNGLGMTPFQQRVNFRRALEGELARTISRLAPVQSARVHITIPEKAVFQRDKVKPRAAVVLNLLPGQSLSGTEASGIAHLLSGSVEGLEANQITLLDSTGRLLARPGSEDGDVLAAEALDVQRGIERDLARRAETLLDAALGSGKAVVTVSAAISTRRFEETQERVNPDESAVLSEQRVEESRSEPSALAGGVPGAAANVPGGPGAEVASLQPSTETVTRETLNFDISRSSSRTIVPMGQIQRLSIAVMVDGTYTTPAVAEGEEPAAPEYQPRAPAEIQQITEIVKRAVGFDAERGDLIEVQNFPFRSPLEDFPTQNVPLWKSPELFVLLPTVGRVVTLLGGLALLALLVIRPALGQLTSLPGVSGGLGGVPGGPGGMGLTAEQQALEIKAAELAIPISKDQAKTVAEAIRTWLRE
jgi:flagellar M-ring protein FliF